MVPDFKSGWVMGVVANRVPARRPLRTTSTVASPASLPIAWAPPCRLSSAAQTRSRHRHRKRCARLSLAPCRQGPIQTFAPISAQRGLFQVLVVRNLG